MNTTAPKNNLGAINYHLNSTNQKPTKDIKINGGFFLYSSTNLIAPILDRQSDNNWAGNVDREP